MHRTIRKIFVVAVALSLTIDSATAGLFCRRAACEPVCQPAAPAECCCPATSCSVAPECEPTCCGGSAEVPAAVVDCCGCVAQASVVSSDCGCGESSVGTVIESAPMVSEAAPADMASEASEPTPVEAGKPASEDPAPALPPAPEPMDAQEDEPESDADTAEQPMMDEAASEASPSDEMMADEAPQEESAPEAVTDLLGLPPSPTTPEPAAADEMFGDDSTEPEPTPALAEEAPMEQASEMEDPMVMEEPMMNTPAEVAPAEEATEADDLFGGDAPEESAMAPMEGESMIEESEAPETAADGLFGEEPAPAADSAAPMMEAPVTEEATEEATEEPAAESLFGEDSGESTEDMFGGPSEQEPAMEAPAEDAPAEDAPAEEAPAEGEDLEDLFGQLSRPGGLESTELRTWTDNTGLFGCRGRLIAVGDGFVRLMKANGRVTTTPLARLSAADADFVHRQAVAQAQRETTRMAQR